MNKRKLGIVGFGQFGQFMVRHLAPHCDIIVNDIVDMRPEAESLGVGWGSLADVAKADIIVLAVPLPSFADVLPELYRSLRSKTRFTLVLDVCSVKSKPIELMLDKRPNAVQIIGTHPLFGPQSGKDGIAGLRICVCPVLAVEWMVSSLRSFLADTLGLKVIMCTPEEHDREMAKVQALTHFIARGLDNMGIADSELATVAYQHLLKVAELLGCDSWPLFVTIQEGNPYAKEVREKFMWELTGLQELLH